MIGNSSNHSGENRQMAPLDSINQKILAELLADGRISMMELAARVGLSKTPVTQRVRQMEESGLITGYRATVSRVKLGLTHVTFVEVKMSDTRQIALDKFNAAVRAVPEIEECYMIAGGFDYLLKVRSRDMVHFRQILAERISSLPYLHATSSFVAMEAVVEQG
jgi:Lrp/AsnC family transcriptional regulator, leucine-responsive regulatory protein